MFSKYRLKASFNSGIIAFFVVIIFSNISFSQVSPSHVFQVTENVRAELLLMHDQNFTAPTPPRFVAMDKRPRHVLQKAREILLKIHSLKQLKGLPTRDIPAFKVRLIEAREVKQLVERVLEETKDLRPAFDVEELAAAAQLSTGKTPSDVYANLMLVGYLIDELGIPKVVPNDVYRVAGAIVQELNMIHNQLGIDTEYTGTPASDKIPADVFAVAQDVLVNLKKAVKRRDIKVPGGIVAIGRKSGTITPGDVLNVMNNVLAELGAIKFSIGVTDATIIPPLLPGKTPSNVFDMITHANVLAKRM